MFQISSVYFSCKVSRDQVKKQSTILGLNELSEKPSSSAEYFLLITTIERVVFLLVAFVVRSRVINRHIILGVRGVVTPIILLHSPLWINGNGRPIDFVH